MENILNDNTTWGAVANKLNRNFNLSANKVIGKNRFNRNDPDVTENYYVQYSTGNLVASTPYYATGYVPVESGITYTRSYNHQMAFYDINKVYISGINAGNPDAFTAPANAKYARFTVNKESQYWDVFQVEEGTEKTIYEDYAEYLPDSLIKDLSITGSKIANGTIGAGKTSFLDFTIGKNKFNKNANDISLSYYVVDGSGGLSPSPTYNSTGFIPVTSGETYTRNFEHNMAFYDSSKVYISGIPAIDNIFTFTVPAGAAYCRFTVPAVNWDAFQVEVGSIQTAYEAYEEYYQTSGIKILTTDILGIINEFKNTLYIGNNEISIPAKQYLIDGYENSIYFEAIMKRWKPYDHFMRLSGGEWENYKAFARITNPTAESTGVSINIYDLNFEAIATASFNVLIGNQATDNGLLTILAIGDSLTHNSSYLIKAKTLCPNLAFDGMRVPYSDGTLLGEGRGGWTLASYFNNIIGSSTDSFSPFLQPIDPYKYYGNTDFWIEVKSGSTDYGINGFADKATEIGFDAVTGLLLTPSNNDVMWVDANSRYEVWNGSAWVEIAENTLNFSFNFSKYRTVWNIAQPNIVTIMLGTNDFRSAGSETALDTLWTTWKNNFETLATSILADNANIKIALLIPPSVGGSLDNVNNAFTVKQKAMMWYARKLIIADFDEREAEGIYLVDVGSSIDPLYGFTETYVDPFSDYTGTEQRMLHNNVPHPSTGGYYQMGARLAGFIQKVR